MPARARKLPVPTQAVDPVLAADWYEAPITHTKPGRKSLPQPRGRQRTVYVGPVLETLLSTAVAFSSTSPSHRLETIARRFEHFRDGVFRDLRDRWTVAEWAVLVTALREGAGLLEPEAWKVVVYFAAAYQAEMQALNGVDALAVANKLRDAGQVANVAVVDTVEQYWAQPITLHHGDRLRLLGLVDSASAKAWDAQRDTRIALAKQIQKRREREQAKQARKGGLRVVKAKNPRARRRSGG